MMTVETNPIGSIDPQSCTLLIVDDEPANLATVTDYLAGYGFQIKVAQTGETGLELARLAQPNLILLDVRLPGIDGFETCRRLKADERTREIPVIFMTIVTKTEDKVRGFEVGGVDYITKPFQQEEVLARVVAHLRLRDLTRRLEEAKESLERRVEERTAALTQANQELQAEIAERRRVEAALKRERALIANIMDTSPVGITVVNREGQVTFANSQAEQVLGLSKDEITQRTYNALAWRITDFASDPFPDEKLPFRQVMTTQQSVYDVQHAIEWPDRRRVFLSINGAPLLNEAGEVESVVFALQDITERKRAEEELQMSESRLNEAQRIAHIGSWELNLINNVLTWSDEIFRIFEIDPDKFGATYEAFLDTIHPDDREAVNFAYTNSLTTKTPYAIDHRLLFSDGRIKYVHEQCETFYDGDNPIRSIGTVQDITERKLAEEALHRLNRELRAISDCNQVLMRAEDEQTLLNDICCIVCDEAGYRMVWVGYAEHDEAKLVRPVAWAGVEEGYLAAANITWADTERGRGPTGAAIRTGESACIQDFTTDPKAAPWREAALQRGYRSSIALPLKDENAHTFGALNIYSREPNAFTPDETRLMEELAGDLAFGLTVLRARTELKRAEQERLAHLRFFEYMDQINRAMQGTNDLEQMMSDVLDLVLSILECDRAFMMYPCDPEAVTWRVPMERNKPEYPGAQELGLEMPMDADVAETLRLLLAADGPVKFGPGTPYPLPADVAEQFGFKCCISMALHPKVGKPWQFGLHQCSYARIWTAEEERLFQEIGRRLADGLSTLLAYRDLQESENRYRRITEGLTDYQYSVRVEDGRAVETTQSQACETVTGYTPEEFAADPYLWFHMIAPEDREPVQERIQQVLAGIEIPPLEHRLIRKDGAVRWVCDTTILLKDASGKLLGYDGVIKDITQRRQAEEEIRTLNQKLEQRVLDRTAQLEAANKELEAFAYSVSHDLRAPLRHIDGFLELLQERLAANLDDRSRHYMDTISDATKRMGQLIDDLLAFSRMGRNELFKTGVDLGVLVQEIIRELAPETQDRAINWRIAPLPTVTGDRAMLSLVLTNLLSNALKFTRGRPQVDIEIGCQAGQKETTFFVRDNGVGFDMAYADKLFGVFQRLHRADEFEGTGIGLANVRRIINRHGGRVWAEGQENQGATFYFSLPCYTQGGY